MQEENNKYLQKIISLSKEKAENCLSGGSSQQLSTTKNPISKEKPREKMKNTIKSNGTSQVKDLALKQLKDIIDEIYLSKEKYDQKCIDSHQAKETMEEYMYSYLNKKYGLKSLIGD